MFGRTGIADNITIFWKNRTKTKRYLQKKKQKQSENCYVIFGRTQIQRTISHSYKVIFRANSD